MKFKQKFLLAALVPAFLLSACGEENQQAQSRPPMNVAAIDVNTEPLQIFTTLPGRINAIKDAQVRARVTGIVQSINFEQGSEVKEGQVLFKIDPATYQAAVDAAAASLSQAQATEASSTALANRYKVLIQENAVSQQEYDNAVAAARQAAAAVEAAKANLETAKINLSYTDVISPIDGIVGKALVTEGALVSATEATQLATVQNLNEVYVDFTQSTGEITQLRKALQNGELESVDKNTAVVRLILEDGTTYATAGKLLFSGVTVDPDTGKVNLRAVFPNPDHILLPGMFVQVQLERGFNKAAVMIPTQAIQRQTDGSNMVYVVADGKVAMRPVQLGEASGNKTQITSGLTVGEKLIVEGFTKIGPGAPVNVLPWSKDAKGSPNQNTAKTESAGDKPAAQAADSKQ